MPLRQLPPIFTQNTPFPGIQQEDGPNKANHEAHCLKREKRWVAHDVRFLAEGELATKLRTLPRCPRWPDDLAHVDADETRCMDLQMSVQ